MRECKVLFVTPGCFDKGGISRYSRYQIRALRNILGEENVRVYSLTGPDGTGFEDPVGTYWNGSNGTATASDRFSMALRLTRDALLWRPQLIHSAHVNFSPLISQLGKVSGAKTLLNVYGLELWSGLSDKRLRAMREHDLIIADCHATADYVISHRMHSKEPKVIWDCVDLERFQPGPRDPILVERYGLPNPKFHRIVMSLGRLAKGAAHKGFDRLIESFAAVRAQVPEARLVIAGKGDDRPRLEQLAREIGIAELVSFIGPVDEAHLPGIYRYADVFSLVSDFGQGRGEGIPLSPLEAMACGVPIVVGDEDGSKEAIDGHRNGRVVSPRSPAQLVAAIVDLLKADEVHFKRETRAVAEERFDYQAFRAKHQTIYSSMLEG
ncbi:glycosyltransferase family 4 protein [Mesorhizobium sp. M1169]|uniref:glycosyltransferase family 4 protein n=1 Tax=Mesorhizobium sp. M1169 TaxID=2957066 RepID=UPI0033362A8E